MEKFPKVSIIVLNYNGKNCIEKTLKSVYRVNYPDFNVVLVDNNSTDGSLEFIRRNFPKIGIIKNDQNLGFSAGNNIGIKYALERGADYILLLNYDTEVKSNFLLHLIKTMQSDKKNGIGSPVIFKGKNKDIWFSGGKIGWIKMKTFHQTKKIVKDYFNSDYISGCSMIIKKDVFEKIGLLDEDFFLYWEDADFSLRTKKAGFKLVVSAKSEVFHMEKSQERMEKKIYWLVISGLIFFKKNTPLFLKPWILFYMLIRKIKNKRDVKNKKGDLISESVGKAYADFKCVE